jgi:hypothetical protein
MWVTRMLTSTRRRIAVVFGFALLSFVFVEAFIFPSEVPEPWTITIVNAIVCCTGLALGVVFALVTARTGSAVAFLLYGLAGPSLVCWLLLGVGFAAFATIVGSVVRGAILALASFAAVLVPLVALTEWKVMNRYWAECVKHGRIDLARARHDIDVPSPMCSAPTWLQIGTVGIGVIAVASIVLNATTETLDTEAAQMGLFFTVTAGLFGLMWPQTLGLLIRVVRWERQSGRKMLVIGTGKGACLSPDKELDGTERSEDVEHE